MMLGLAVWAVAGGLMLALGSAGQGQQGTRAAVGEQVAQTTVPEVAPPDSRTLSMEREQAKIRNTERQKKLVEDTTKLVELANELKAAVDKTDKNTLSLDVVRKADEIEKLAHSVKEKMKGD